MLKITNKKKDKVLDQNWLEHTCIFAMAKIKFKTEFARGPGRGDTCHLSDLDETLPD